MEADFCEQPNTLKSGGETGIRTLGTVTSTTVFETAPFDHSGISPRCVHRTGRRRT